MKARYIVSKRIKEIREAKGITDVELSVAIGKNKDYIYKLENNLYKKSASIGIISMISTVLDVPVEELFMTDKKLNKKERGKK